MGFYSMSIVGAEPYFSLFGMSPYFTKLSMPGCPFWLSLLFHFYLMKILTRQRRFQSLSANIFAVLVTSSLIALLASAIIEEKNTGSPFLRLFR